MNNENNLLTRQAMGFLTERSLKELEFYLKEAYGAVGVCFSQFIPAQLLDASKITSFYYYDNVEPEINLVQRFIKGELVELPFLTDSVDTFVIWHNLDFQAAPQKILKEIWRCLSPNGLLFIVGENSNSLFNAFAAKNNMKRIVRRTWIVKFLQQQGFSIEIENTFGFHPKHCSARFQSCWNILEVIGQFCFPMMGAKFLIQAIKSQLGLLMPLSKERNSKLVSPQGLAESTRRI